ncbi:hypothetical protein CNY67_06845 [Desulfovibrio sp. G11]|nr:hypothetical protein CNY67_06845 [Desulfovibrio sp. G11]
MSFEILRFPQQPLPQHPQAKRWAAMLRDLMTAMGDQLYWGCFVIVCAALFIGGLLFAAWEGRW